MTELSQFRVGGVLIAIVCFLTVWIINTLSGKTKDKRTREWVIDTGTRKWTVKITPKEQ
jgi:hypothetical protein